MNLRTIGFVIYGFAAVLCGFTILHDDGVVGQTKKPLVAPVFLVKGCFCHDDTASVQTRVWITGPETLAAGARAIFSINVAKDSSIAAGFDVAAFFGDLGVYDSAETQLMRIDGSNPVDSLELTHVDPKLANGQDTISWSFYYRAPSTVGRIDTIYASGNSVDLSFDPSGDHWNYAPNFLVRVVSPTTVFESPVPQSIRLMQNYPNPFNPSTVIRFELPVPGHASLCVYDIDGRKVQELVNGYLSAGTHDVRFIVGGASGEISSGVYLYRLELQPPPGMHEAFFRDTRKMVFLK